MRIAVFVLICLGLVSCEKEEVTKRAVRFDERDVLDSLFDVSGRLEYFNSPDTSFIYLRPDDPRLPALLTDGCDLNHRIEQWLRYGFVDVKCRSRLPEFDFEYIPLKVVISGKIRSTLSEDTLLLDIAVPFTIDTLVKVKECRVSYERKIDGRPLQDTKWRFEKLLLNNDTIYPTCEVPVSYLEFSSGVSRDLPSEIRSDTIYHANAYFGITCCGYYYSKTQSELFIGVGSCCLRFIESTKDMFNVGNEVLKHLRVGFYEESVPYLIEGNTLTIGSQESGYAVFVAEE